MKYFLILSFGFFLSMSASAEIFVTSKHLVILRSGIDTVWGSYVFAVNNKGETPDRIAVQIMMPAEMTDFYPQEGVTKDEVQLATNGLMVDKEFTPGVNVISIGFKVPSKFGSSSISFTPSMDIDSFTLLIPRESGVRIESTELALGDSDARPDPQYEPYVSKSILKSGAKFSILVSGVPEGRFSLWISGGIAGCLLLLGGVLLAFRTRPKISEKFAV